MEQFEQYLSRMLEQFPLVKRCIKDAYQYVMLPIRVSTPSPVGRLRWLPGCFVGFHDVCPWSADGTKLLAHRYAADHWPHPRNSQGPGSCDIGYCVCRGAYEFHRIGTTRACNWQEGARLQWAGPGRLIWNDVSGGKAISVEYDLEKQSVRVAGPAIHAVSSTGRLASVVSYPRIGKWSMLYSYNGISVDEITADTAMRVLEISSGRVVAEIPMRRIQGHLPTRSMEGANHYVSHSAFSPDERWVSFFHCWHFGANRRSRLCLYDIETANLVLSSLGEWVSHYCWLGSTKLVLFAEDGRNQRRFQVFDIDSLDTADIAPLRGASDGHPHVSPSGRWLVTDTYADRHMCQELRVLDMREGRKYLLLRLQLPYRFRHGYRCDFHPRFDRFGDAICFDGIHRGVRSVGVLEGWQPALDQFA